MADATCSIDGCLRAVSCRGMCNPHYQRWYSDGGREVARRAPARRETESCSIEGCGKPFHCKGLCRAHYRAAYHASNRERLLPAMKDASRRHYVANREKVLIGTRARQKAEPERHRRYARERYRADPAKHAAAKAARRARNPERYRASDAAYARRHPDIMALKVRRRRARKLENGVYQITERDRRRALARHDRCCAYCHEPLGAKFDWDHIVPLARGGHHAIGNLAAACGACNRSKHALTITEWRMRQRRRRGLPAA
ncbi:HNH endonuclease signature motif containing protein [Microbacterium lacticum]|uniref:HNH endonuclease n=1 Tax=Microbacterium lacticum TaxID=33885 RepID=UPI0028D027E1|nr:HNH endonuclease signature motif containing protein [Microbacterium lacticum]